MRVCEAENPWSSTVTSAERFIDDRTTQQHHNVSRQSSTHQAHVNTRSLHTHRRNHFSHDTTFNS